MRAPLPRLSDPEPRRRRGWRRLASLSLAAVVLASCAGDGDQGVARRAGDTDTTAAAKPSGPQELVVGYIADPWVDASPGDQKRKPNYPLNADVCETLVRLGSDFEVEPSTTTVEYQGDNTFRFTLRDGVTFSDGSPVTAEDLKYSIDYTVKEPSVGFSFIGPESTKVVGARSIDITPTKPNLRLAEQINHPSYAILKTGSDPFTDLSASVCTGPFKVQSYVPEQQLVVVKNENYWGTPAKLDKITFRFYPDDTTRALALQNGEVDMIADVPLGILSSIESQAGVEIVRAPVGNTTLMYLARRNADGTPRLLADPLLRKAVAASIDREAFVKGVLAGNAEVIPHVAPPAVLGTHADKVKGIPYDPDEAGTLLDQAGWTRAGTGVRTKDGQPLKVSIIYARIDLTTAEFVQAQLRKVGFDAEVLQLDAGAYRARLDSGDYDIDISQPNQNDANPAFLMALRWYSKATGKNAQIISPGPGTTYEKMIDEILQEEDPEELRRRSAEAMHELVDVEVGSVTLAGGYRVYALKDRVHGFVAHPSSTNQRWSTVYMTR